MGLHETQVRLSRRRTRADVEAQKRQAKQGPDIHSATITANDALVQPPIGAMMEWPVPNDPADGKWLICDGRVLDSDDYPELYAVLGVFWNDGTETAGRFRLPDRTNRVGVGASASHPLGEKFGAETHALSLSESPTHNHGGSTGSVDLTHNHGGTTGSVDLTHAHGGSTGAVDLTHNHGGSTGAVDLTHAHGGTTGSDSHFHGGSTGAGGAHDHAAYAAGDSANDSSSQGWPNDNQHNSFRSSDRTRAFAMHNAAISSAGAHGHAISLNTHGHAIPASLDLHGHGIAASLDLHGHTIPAALDLHGHGIPASLDLHGHGIASQGGNGAHNNLQPSLGIYYILRARP